MNNSDRVIRVSTITPCFRMKRYLPRFLEDLPKQTLFPHFEVVLDHNEPDEEEISWVKDFQARYPGVIRHIIVPKVDPIGTSMNRCIAEAQSSYVAIWNVDDLRTPESLAAQVQYLDDHLDIGVVYGPYRVVRSWGATNGTLVDDRKDAAHDEEFRRSMLVGPFFMFRKELVSQAGWFDEQLRSGADFDLAIRLAFHAGIGCVEDVLGYYLNEGKGASTRPGSLQAVERTVIELRYGMYDKLDYRLVTRVNPYWVGRMAFGKEWLEIANFVPDYPVMLARLKDSLVAVGLVKFFFRWLFQVDRVRMILRVIVRYLGFLK